jgi:hypothetical protein
MAPPARSRTLRRPPSLALCAAALWSGGCSAVASGGIRQGQLEFNRSVVDTLDEQLLLNLVRLRYRDTPYFIEVSNITTQQSVTAGAQVTAPLGLPDLSSGRTFVTPNVSGSFSYAPTVVYAPLQGEAFVRRLIAPVPLLAAVVLSQSGWSISRVLRLTVDRINSVRNAPSAAGPTPLHAPDFADFKRLSEELRSMQIADQVAFSPLGKGDGDGFLLLIDKDPQAARAAAVIKELLKLSPELQRIPVAHDFTQPEHDRVTLRMRSVLSSMFYLSQAVDVPAEHEAQGLVTVTKNGDGTRFDWQQVLGDLFRVRSGPRAPATAYVKAFHRGAWFWIDDADLESKTTFLLLVQLFIMQASHKDQLVPMLTLPVGH